MVCSDQSPTKYNFGSFLSDLFGNINDFDEFLNLLVNSDSENIDQNLFSAGCLFYDYSITPNSEAFYVLELCSRRCNYCGFRRSSSSFISESSMLSPTCNVCCKMDKRDSIFDKCFYILDVDSLPTGINQF